MNRAAGARGRRAGFTLLETLIALLVLSIVMVGVFREINRTQTLYGVEDQKADLTSQQREFIDQFARDLHQAGYPPPVSIGLVPPKGGFTFNGLTANTNFPTTVEMQGDLGDGNGTSTVTYTYNAGPQTLTRTVQVGGGPAVPTTAVENVIAASFTGYNITGGPPATLDKVRSIRIEFSTQGVRDTTNRRPIQINMTGMARLPNND